MSQRQEPAGLTFKVDMDQSYSVTGLCFAVVGTKRPDSAEKARFPQLFFGSRSSLTRIRTTNAAIELVEPGLKLLAIRQGKPDFAMERELQFGTHSLQLIIAGLKKFHRRQRQDRKSVV
jgi:hypothetical protein